jgi:transcriptional regulator with XRE-family HTH domain
MKRNRFAVPALQLKSLGIAIQQRRLELNISQEHLAEQAGLHRTYVSLIERKSCNLSLMKMFCIAQVLELAPVELLEMAANLGTIKKRA